MLHPNTVTAASTFSLLSANYDLAFRLADVDYTVLLTACDCYAVNLDVGIRYAHLDQGFEQFGDFASAAGSEQTTTGIGFDGVGVRMGLDGQWRLGQSQLSLYNKGFLSMLFGQFDSHYRQYNVTTDTVEAAAHWDDHRVVPILEYELGIRWNSCNGHWLASTGYYTAFWFNTVNTSEFIHAVQNGNYTSLSSTTTFTGLTSRVEYRF